MTEYYIDFAEGFFEKAKQCDFSEDRFWTVVDECRTALNRIPVDPFEAHEYEVFQPLLRSLTNEELFYANEHFSTMFWKLYYDELWSAVVFIEGGCSDDSFMDFREWLISCGREACELVLNNTHSLPDIIRQYKRNTISSEGLFSGVFCFEFEKRTGFEIPVLERNTELRGKFIPSKDMQSRLPECYKYRAENPPY